MNRMASFSVISAALHLTTSSLGFAQTFEKNASQFCVSKLSAEDQSKFYSRILNIGASYSHGCAMCDINPAFSKNLKADGDFHWMRRNFFAHFLNLTEWKDKKEFSWEFMSVLENDPASSFALTVPQKDLRRGLYNGTWQFDPTADKVSVMDLETQNMLASDPLFVDEGYLVGGTEVRRNTKIRQSTRYGTLYQTYPGRLASQGAKQKTIIDLAVDTSRTQDIFRLFGDPKIYASLEKSGWRDASTRKLLIEKTAASFASTKPTIMFGVDMLFWDSVPRLFAIAQKAKPESLVIKFVTSAIFRNFIGMNFYDDVQRNNMLHDFYEVMALVSRGNSHDAPPVPVLIGRLIDNPGRYIKAHGLEPEFGALLGQFVEIMTGRDFTAEFTHWLRQIAFESVPSIAAGGNQNQFPATLATEAHSRVPRIGAYTDPLSGQTFTQDEVAAIRIKFENMEKRVNAELTKHGYAQGLSQDMSLNQSTRRQANDSPNLLPNRAQKDIAVPAPLRGILNSVILSAMGDLPLLIKSADEAFAYQNKTLREFAARTDNNVHIINVDLFYSNFYKFVNPHSIHPSVEGAKAMAGLVDTAVCNSTTND